MDGDGDTDLMTATETSANANKVLLLENSGGNPVTWPAARTLTGTTLGLQSLFVADVDGDLDLDLLTASATDSRLAYFENNGGLASSWTQRTITTAASGVQSVAAAE
jgi:hypothetical protein